MTFSRIIAASIALAFTSAIMVIVCKPHPPAGATTLIIALSFITQPFSLFMNEAAVVLLAIQAVLVNRLIEIKYGSRKYTFLNVKDFNYYIS